MTRVESITRTPVAPDPRSYTATATAGGTGLSAGAVPLLTPIQPRVFAVQRTATAVAEAPSAKPADGSSLIDTISGFIDGIGSLFGDGGKPDAPAAPPGAGGGPGTPTATGTTGTAGTVPDGGATGTPGSSGVDGTNGTQGTAGTNGAGGTQAPQSTTPTATTPDTGGGAGGWISKIAGLFKKGKAIWDKASGFFKGLFGGSKTQVEQDRWKKLQDAGYKYVGEGATDPSKKAPIPKGQMAAPELGPDFVGFNPQTGQWVNNQWSISHDESTLTGRDIWGYAAFAETFGNAWMEMPEEGRLAIADQALKLGLVREHHGTIDVNFTPELIEFSKQVLGGATADPAATSDPTAVPDPTATSDPTVAPDPTADPSTGAVAPDVADPAEAGVAVA